ncbi:MULTISPECIES: hypothetical protein [unclassified Streptomyces]|uniref:hypothetical protein n=1 Tax=unclassified Streptomyces TaxID=2593676 RepID=UPI002E804EB0|nr:hypothetical protein [Streptomyces sp. NBC_00589]WTI42288.1 hypothetical protein OIC96_48965 [Streptomyces sp. NBC_00775]WUB24030.1 hypothetical protein OHA51_00765 [Streptomyces sp. NBC_00589]
MPKPLDPAGLSVFLAELHGFFEACDESVDQALADQFGFDTAVDWITVSLELATEQPAPVPTRELPGEST